MLKNLRIQLFIELELYQKLLIHAKECGYYFKTDSELVRILLTRLLGESTNSKTTIYMMQTQINAQKQDKIQMQTVIDLLQGQLRDRRKDKAIKDHNKQIKKKVKK